MSHVLLSIFFCLHENGSKCYLVRTHGVNLKSNDTRWQKAAPIHKDLRVQQMALYWCICTIYLLPVWLFPNITAAIKQHLEEIYQHISINQSYIFPKLDTIYKALGLGKFQRINVNNSNTTNRLILYKYYQLITKIC